MPVKLKPLWKRLTHLVRLNHWEQNQRQDLALVMSLRGQKAWPQARQWRYIHKFYSPQELVATKTALAVILLSLLFLGGVVYKTRVALVPAAGGEYIEAIVGTPTYINPAFSQTNNVDQDLSRLIFSGLMAFNGQGDLVGDLAEGFSIDSAQTTYTINLKPNLTWHDSMPITASDVVFTIESIKDQNFKSPLYNTFRNVQAKMADELTVDIILPEPFAPFASLLTFGILPEHLWQEIDPSHALLAELNLKPIGSGPYRFAGLLKDKKGNILEYRLERFAEYHASGPFIDNINFKFFATADEAIAAVKTGNADGLGLVAGKTSQELAATQAWSVYQLGLPQYTALFFNQGANAALAEKAVREALSLGTDRQAIISASWPNNARTINSPLLANSSADINPVFDRQAAAAKLEAASWQAGADGIRAKKIKRGPAEETVPLEIKLTTVQKEENIQTAEAIREQWQAIGVKVNLEIVDISQIQRNIIKPRAYEVLLFGQILGRDIDPYPFWHSSQINDPGLNLALYNNKETDKLLEEARRTTNNDIRAKNYLAFEKKLNEDIPAIFLYSLKFTYLLPGKINGVATSHINQPSDRFSTVNEWYIKTKKRIKF